jgi:hypothetical protein
MELRKLRDMPMELERLRVAASSSDAQQFERVAKVMDSCVRALTPVSRDRLGFELLCHEAQIAWVRTLPTLQQKAHC